MLRYFLRAFFQFLHLFSHIQKKNKGKLIKLKSDRNQIIYRYVGKLLKNMEWKFFDLNTYLNAIESLICIDFRHQTPSNCTLIVRLDTVKLPPPNINQ